jgi:translocation and assembly module TamB
MTRRRLALLFAPALLILLLAGAFWWLLHTQPGAHWLLGRIAAAVPGELTYGRIAGDLQTGLEIEDLRLRDTGFLLETEQLQLRLDLDFWPPAVTVHRLRVVSLGLHTEAGSEADSTEASPDWLTALSLPVPVEFKEVRGDRIAWHGGSEDEPLEIHDVAFSAYWFRSLELDALECTVFSSRWRADLALGLQAPHELRVDLAGTANLPESYGLGHPLEIRASADGDMSRSSWRVRVADPEVQLAGELRDLLSAPAWDLQLDADRLQWPPAAAEPDLVLDNLVASSYGNAADYGLEIDATLGGAGVPEADGRLVGSGNLSGLDIRSLALAGEALQLEGSGRIDWDPTLRVRTQLDVARLDPEPWLPAWNGAEPLSGSVELAWDAGKLEIPLLELEAAGTVAALSGAGVVDPDSGEVNASLRWQGFVWPPGAEDPAVSSESGEVTLAGSLDDWRGIGWLALDGKDFPAGRLQIDGTGNRQSLRIQVPQGAVLGGSVAGDLDVAWSPDLRWAVRAQLANIATEPLAPSFPGRLSGAVAVTGASDPAMIDIEIETLTGQIRARQVRASGKLVLQDGSVYARGLRVASGRSRLGLDGALDDPQGLSFDAHIESLEDFLDGASGSFVGSWIVSMNPAGPILRVNGQGEGLLWGNTAIAELVVDTTTGPRDAVRLEMLGIELGDSRIEALTAVADGVRPLERLDLRVTLPDADVHLRMEGRVNDWAEPFAAGWSGELQALRLDGRELGFIELEEPAALQWRDTALLLAPACFRGSREGRFCAEATWRPRGQRELALTLEDMSPNLAVSLMGSDLVFSQRLSGTVEWHQQPSARAAARVNLRISEGQITERGEEEAILQTGAGVFGFEVADGRLYGGNLDIPVPGSGGIDTDFSVPDLSAGVDSEVQGQLRVQLRDIAPLLRLVPGVEGSSGPMTAEMNFSGSLSDPRLTGHASLVRGRLSHFASGLVLEDIRLAGAVYQYDQTELNGTFRAGSGEGSIRVVVNFDEILEPELLVLINGEDLTLIDVPDLNLKADPDIRVVWREGVLNLDGRVAVPSARLSPRYLPTAVVSESADVVVVAGVDPLVRPEESKATNWRLNGSLQLELGDDVQLQLERATARLSGNTRFSWNGQLIPVADGGFSLSGEIYAYGQLLKVTEGRINFSNRPADNPFLNIRAEREIYGNSQVTRAGVLVTGTLKQPILEPYSVPMTTRERALTLLITGSDINYEQGVGSVEVGMYVAPKLFISYGIGLFDDQSVISARYDLGKGWGIKTTSGQRESGADISYTIER